VHDQNDLDAHTSHPHHPDHDHPDDQHRHHDPHDWSSATYVARWAVGQDRREDDRRQAFDVLADTLADGGSGPPTFLDVGAGYGALTAHLLDRFANATAVCQDGSEAMADLGRERMQAFGDRFSYVIADFSRPGWSRALSGPFDAVVSSLAIHNVGSADGIRAIYGEAFGLLRPGGSFLAFDLIRGPFEGQLDWLRDGGFADVRLLWTDAWHGVFGGTRPGTDVAV
jgi:SAM-dependent methyltransferase